MHKFRCHSRLSPNGTTQECRFTNEVPVTGDIKQFTYVELTMGSERARAEETDEPEGPSQSGPSSPTLTDRL